MGGRDISAFSMFPAEREVILLANTALEVGTRMSITLLLLAGFTANMVCVSEIGTVSTGNVLEVRLAAMRASAYLYEPIRNGYVTPRVAASSDDKAPCLPLFGDGSTPLPWLEPPNGALHALLANGGMGKTIASLRMWLVVADGFAEHGRTPLFVSLPQVLAKGAASYNLAC